MPKLRLLVLPNGDVEAVYDDALLKLGLGTITQVERASHVEFNVATQRWEAIHAKTGRIMITAAKRDTCVSLEKLMVHHTLVDKHCVLNPDERPLVRT